MRLCTVCAEGLIPAPPAARVCPVCGAVGTLPSYRDVPDGFREWLTTRWILRRLEARITWQQLFKDMLMGVYVGRSVGEGPTAMYIRYATEPGDVYRYALQDFYADLSANRLPSLWEV